MGDEQLIHQKFPKNFGRVWLELLEDEKLSEHARICYAVMTSFGEEVRVGKESIRRRMGVKSITTVKAAQNELNKAGWIKCLKMGGGISPTIWETYSRPFDGALPLFAGQDTPHPGRVVSQAVGHEVPPKQEDKQERHKPSATPKGAAKHPSQNALWDHHCQTWAQDHPGQPSPEWPRLRGFQGVLSRVLERFPLPELIRRHENLRLDPWAQDKTFAALIYKPDKWITRRYKNGDGPDKKPKREMPPI